MIILLLIITIFSELVISQQCNSTSDCPIPGQYCDVNQCQITRCSFSSNCPNGSYCSNTQCVPIRCSDTGDCFSSLNTCNVNTRRCIPSRCLGPGTGDECPPPYICSNFGQCVPGVALCFSETDCPVDFFCLCGRCTPLLCMITPDCLQFSGSSECQTGNCLPIPGSCAFCTFACPPYYACSNSSTDNAVCLFTNQTNAPTFQPTPSPTTQSPSSSPPPTTTLSPTLPTMQPSSSSPPPTITISPTTNSTTNDQDRLNLGIFLILYVIVLIGLLILFIGYRRYRKNSTPK